MVTICAGPALPVVALVVPYLMDRVASSGMSRPLSMTLLVKAEELIKERGFLGFSYR